MKEKTTKATKLRVDRAYKTSVSEGVSGWTTVHSQSCCETMIASNSKTVRPNPQSKSLRRRPIRFLCPGLKFSSFSLMGIRCRSLALMSDKLQFVEDLQYSLPPQANCKFIQSD